MDLGTCEGRPLVRLEALPSTDVYWDEAVIGEDVWSTEREAIADAYRRRGDEMISANRVLRRLETLEFVPEGDPDGYLRARGAANYEAQP